MPGETPRRIWCEDCDGVGWYPWQEEGGPVQRSCQTCQGQGWHAERARQANPVGLRAKGDGYEIQTWVEHQPSGVVVLAGHPQLGGRYCLHDGGDWPCAAVRSASLPAQPVEPGRLDGAYRLALIQIEHDGEVIKRLTQALRVATHSPHDQAGEPDDASGYPTCSECGAIQTAPALDTLDAQAAEVERLRRVEAAARAYVAIGTPGMKAPPAEYRALRQALEDDHAG